MWVEKGRERRQDRQRGRAGCRERVTRGGVGVRGCKDDGAGRGGVEGGGGGQGGRGSGGGLVV